MCLIGLAGSHRTGKTSLAKAYAEKQEIEFVETSVSSIIKGLGYSPKIIYDFGARMYIQEHVLTEVDKMLSARNTLVDAITDRTPLDMLAYTMAEAIGDKVTDEYQDQFERYTTKCFDVTNKHYAAILQIQPALPIVDSPTSQVPNKAYMEHLNSLLLGYRLDPRLKTPHFFLKRDLISMRLRIAAVDNTVTKALRMAETSLREYEMFGGSLH
jgi:hypothetical protein